MWSRFFGPKYQPTARKPNPGHRSDTTTNYVAFRRPVQGKTQILTSNPVVLHSQVTDDLLHQVFCVYPIVRCTNLPDRCQLAGEATLPYSPWVSATLHSEPRFQRVQRPERAMRISAIVLDGATNGKSFNGAGELAGRMSGTPTTQKMMPLCLAVRVAIQLSREPGKFASVQAGRNPSLPSTSTHAITCVQVHGAASVTKVVYPQMRRSEVLLILARHGAKQSRPRRDR